MKVTKYYLRENIRDTISIDVPIQCPEVIWAPIDNHAENCESGSLLHHLYVFLLFQPENAQALALLRKIEACGSSTLALDR